MVVKHVVLDLVVVLEAQLAVRALMRRLRDHAPLVASTGRTVQGP
jgi:hypothetical protein